MLRVIHNSGSNQYEIINDLNDDSDVMQYIKIMNIALPLVKKSEDQQEVVTEELLINSFDGQKIRIKQLIVSNEINVSSNLQMFSSNVNYTGRISWVQKGDLTDFVSFHDVNYFSDNLVMDWANDQLDETNLKNNASNYISKENYFIVLGKLEKLN